MPCPTHLPGHGLGPKQPPHSLCWRFAQVPSTTHLPAKLLWDNRPPANQSAFKSNNDTRYKVAVLINSLLAWRDLCQARVCWFCQAQLKLPAAHLGAHKAMIQLQYLTSVPHVQVQGQSRAQQLPWSHREYSTAGATNLLGRWLQIKPGKCTRGSRSAKHEASLA